MGLGLYTPPEAARLVGLSTSTMRRWLRGYRYRYRTKRGRREGSSQPVIEGEVPSLGRLTAVSFLELMEAYIVRQFLDQGVRLSTVRLAGLRGREKFGTEHPFAHRRFKTDGEGIFIELSGATAQGKRKLLLELSKLQYAMPEVLDAYLSRIEFDPDTELAARWWPMGKDTPVVLDPHVAFGAPVVQGTRVPAQVLAEAARAGETVESLCYWYDLGPEEVEAALAFATQRLAA